MKEVVDGDWAGCATTRCSLSGDVLNIGEYPSRLGRDTSDNIVDLSCANGIAAKTLLEEITRENTQRGALDRQLECASNLTATGARKTIGNIMKSGHCWYNSCQNVTS